MDDDVKELRKLILGDVAEASSNTFADDSQQRMESFINGIKMPTRPPVYRHPKVPPVRQVAILAKHR